jgi:hypothetical protein
MKYASIYVHISYYTKPQKRKSGPVGVAHPPPPYRLVACRRLRSGIGGQQWWRDPMAERCGENVDNQRLSRAVVATSGVMAQGC